MAVPESERISGIDPNLETEIVKAISVFYFRTEDDIILMYIVKNL